MAHDELDGFLSRLYATFMAMDIEALAEFFSNPLVIYTKAGLRVVRDTAGLEVFVRRYHEELAVLMVTSGELRIESRETPHDGRMRVLVRTFGYDAEGRSVSTTLLRFFVVQSPAGFKVEMIEYISSPLSLATVEKIVH